MIAGQQPERILILAPRGRDAVVAKSILRDAKVHADICVDLPELLCEVQKGADIAIVTEEALRGSDIRELAAWVLSQPPWSDFPFVVLTQHGGGVERNPAATRLMEMLGNVTFLERPFHPTTLISVVQTGSRGRLRQYECRRLNEELESRVQERTAELAAANRQLLSQIEERERVEFDAAADAAARGGRPAHVRGRPRFQQSPHRRIGQHHLPGKRAGGCRARREADAAARPYADGRRARRQADRPAPVVLAPPAAGAAIA